MSDVQLMFMALILTLVLSSLGCVLWDEWRDARGRHG